MFVGERAAPGLRLGRGLVRVLLVVNRFRRPLWAGPGAGLSREAPDACLRLLESSSFGNAPAAPLLSAVWLWDQQVSGSLPSTISPVTWWFGLGTRLLSRSACFCLARELVGGAVDSVWFQDRSGDRGVLSRVHRRDVCGHSWLRRSHASLPTASPIRVVSGGSQPPVPPRSAPCEGLSPHLCLGAQVTTERRPSPPGFRPKWRSPVSAADLCTSRPWG